MSYLVGTLTSGRGAPTTVLADEPLQHAIDKMMERDYSQLPVVAGDLRPIGLVTSDSILRALVHLGTSISALKVSHARVKAPTFKVDDELPDLLNSLKDVYAALIVDADGRLCGIVTSYDTAEYFRNRAEDMILVENIETDLKEHIRVAFSDDEGALAEDVLSEAILEIHEAKGVDFQKRFKTGLAQYLKLQSGKDTKLQMPLVEQVLANLTNGSSPPSLEELTLNDYIQLLLNKRKREHLQAVFGLESTAVQNVLGAAKDVRNALFHFREVTAKQRDQLRFANDWLKDHRPRPVVPNIPASPVVLSASAPTVETNRAVIQPQHPFVSTDMRIGKGDGICPVEEESSPMDSRYARLAVYLRAQSADEDELYLRFEQVESIIGDRLPAAAYQHRSWWANDSQGHVQSSEWLAVGWRVASVDTERKTVVFARSDKRTQAYASFFNELLAHLPQGAEWLAPGSSPRGLSWLSIEAPVDGLGEGTALFCSFARSGRFRIELYIDTGKAEGNKRMFDALHARRSQIETALGESLAWERMDDQRASRVALYRNGAITDTPAELAALREWAVRAVVRFRTVLASLSTAESSAT